MPTDKFNIKNIIIILLAKNNKKKDTLKLIYQKNENQPYSLCKENQVRTYIL